eukprot:2817995-Karenia_brevis.AAC.1
MLNAENTDYKESCAADMKKSRMKIGTYAHDCSCRIQERFMKKRLARKCALDAYHARKHKCGMKGLKKNGYNSSA